MAGAFHRPDASADRVPLDNDQANSGRQPASPHTPGPIIPKARKTASQPTSRERHNDNQAGDRPRQTNTASLIVPRALGSSPGRVCCVYGS